MEKQPDKTPMKSLRDAYRVSGFRVQARIESYDELDHPAFVVTLGHAHRPSAALISFA
jgi:hypothetical protein